MAVSALELDRGRYHGRIPASDAVDGAYVFELGHSHMPLETFEVGDKIQLRQAIAVDFSVSKLLRVHVKLTAPSVGASDVVWRFRMLFDGTAFYERLIPADGRQVTITRAACSLADAPTPPDTANLDFELELVGLVVLV